MPEAHELLVSCHKLVAQQVPGVFFVFLKTRLEWNWRVGGGGAGWGRTYKAFQTSIVRWAKNNNNNRCVCSLRSWKNVRQWLRPSQFMSPVAGSPRSASLPPLFQSSPVVTESLEQAQFMRLHTSAGKIYDALSCLRLLCNSSNSQPQLKWLLPIVQPRSQSEVD